MENATEALIIAFAVMVFVIALSSSMMTMGQAKEAADHVFYATDKTNFREYYGEKPKDVRIVGMETIIPTIYRQFKENFNVIILDKEYKKVAVYNSFEESQLMNMTKTKMDDEKYTYRGIKYHKYDSRFDKVIWLGSNDEDGRKRVDIDLAGVNASDKYINGRSYLPQLSYGVSSVVEKHLDTAPWYTGDTNGEGLLKWLDGKKFEEYFLEQRFSGKEIKSSENDRLELVKGNSKMWIIYLETED